MNGERFVTFETERTNAMERIVENVIIVVMVASRSRCKNERATVIILSHKIFHFCIKSKIFSLKFISTQICAFVNFIHVSKITKIINVLKLVVRK